MIVLYTLQGNAADATRGTVAHGILTNVALVNGWDVTRCRPSPLGS
jgi:hypothetical protein